MIEPGCRQGPGPDGKDPRIANPMLANLVTCLNMTVAQFAAQLSVIGWGYMHEFPRVVDATGIEGRYDFTISFSLPSAWRKIPVAPAADGMAADPDGTVSIFDAVDKQLGLRLEGRRVPAQVLVIDRVDGEPSENLGGLCTRLPPRGADLQSACRFSICPTSEPQPNHRGRRRYRSEVALQEGADLVAGYEFEGGFAERVVAAGHHYQFVLEAAAADVVYDVAGERGRERGVVNRI